MRLVVEGGGGVLMGRDVGWRSMASQGSDDQPSVSAVSQTDSTNQMLVFFYWSGDFRTTSIDS